MWGKTDENKNPGYPSGLYSYIQAAGYVDLNKSKKIINNFDYL